MRPTASARPNLRSGGSSNDASGCWPASGSRSTTGTVPSDSTSRRSPACTSSVRGGLLVDRGTETVHRTIRCQPVTRASRGGRPSGGPSRPCASGGEGPGRRLVRRRSGRCRRESCGGSRGRRTPWSPRTAEPGEPRPAPKPPSHRPFAVFTCSSQQRPRQQTDDSQDRSHHEHVVGGLGDELAIGVESHRTSIVPFPWKPSRSLAQSGIVTVTLNRPAKKNAANAQMWNELLETFRDDRRRTARIVSSC